MLEMSVIDTGQGSGKGTISRRTRATGPFESPANNDEARAMETEEDTEPMERNININKANVNVEEEADSDDLSFTGFQADQNFQLVQKRKKKNRPTPQGSKVNANNSNIAEHDGGIENIVIVKPEGENASELVENPRVRRLALDNSPFADAGIIKVTPNRAKNLFVVTISDSGKADELCKIKILGKHKVRCHQPFNMRVESCVLLGVYPNVSQDEIEGALREANLPFERTVRLQKFSGGERIPSLTVRVDFLCPFDSIPYELQIDYVPYKIRPFQHNPIRCYFCQQFGHTRTSCKSKSLKCAKCSQNHETKDCNTETDAIKCANCSGAHPSYSRDCPRFIVAKRVDSVARENKISYADATRIIKTDTLPNESMGNSSEKRNNAWNTGPANVGPAMIGVAGPSGLKSGLQQNTLNKDSSDLGASESYPVLANGIRPRPNQTDSACGTGPIVVSRETQTDLTMNDPSSELYPQKTVDLGNTSATQNIEKFKTVGEFLRSEDFFSFVQEVITLANLAIPNPKHPKNLKNKVKGMIKNLCVANEANEARPKEVKENENIDNVPEDNSEASSEKTNYPIAESHSPGKSQKEKLRSNSS